MGCDFFYRRVLQARQGGERQDRASKGTERSALKRDGGGEASREANDAWSIARTDKTSARLETVKAELEARIFSGADQVSTQLESRICSSADWVSTQLEAMKAHMEKMQQELDALRSKEAAKAEGAVADMDDAELREEVLVLREDVDELDERMMKPEKHAAVDACRPTRRRKDASRNAALLSAKHA